MAYTLSYEIFQGPQVKLLTNTSIRAEKSSVTRAGDPGTLQVVSKRHIRLAELLPNAGINDPSAHTCPNSSQHF